MLVSLFTGVLACSWVYALNGFPLVFPDTGPYILSGLQLVAPWDRPIWYGLLLRGLRPVGLDGVALLQLAAAIIAVRIAFAPLDRLRPWATTLLMLILAGFTSLPWFGPFLIPDIFLPVTILALFGLLYGDVQGWRFVGLLAVLLVGVLVHTSHILIAIGIVAVCWMLGILAWIVPGLSIAFVSALTWRRSLAVAGILLTAITGSMAVNRVAFGRWTLSPGGHAFLIDRFMADGTLKRVLDRECGRRAFADCKVRGELPSPPNWYLWSGKSPFWTDWQPDRVPGHPHSGDLRRAEERSRQEDAVLIRMSLRQDLLPHLIASIKATAKQMVMIRTGNELLMHERWPTVEAALSAYEPGALPRFLASRQAHNRLPIDVSNRLNAAFYAVCGLAAAVLLWRNRGIPATRSGALFSLVLLGTVVNAAVCGALSGPHDRYQSRLIWLLAACCVGMVMETVLERRRRPATNRQLGSYRMPVP